MGFEDLDVWKRSARLSAELYKQTRSLKAFGFRDQITRAGLSVPSNIAEGMVILKCRKVILNFFSLINFSRLM